EEARRLLEIVAVAGQPLFLDIAEQAYAGVESQEYAGLQEYPVLAQLRSGHLIRTQSIQEGVVLETYHDRIREAIISNLSSGKRKAYHLALASALEASGKADPEMVFTHFHAAEDNKKAAFYAVEAAERAASTLSFDRAARLYRLVIELDPGERAERQKL